MAQTEFRASAAEFRASAALVTDSERSYREPDVEIRVLGPLDVRSDGVSVRLGGRKQRTVLALLAVDVGKRVSVDALIDGVWGRRADDCGAFHTPDLRLEPASRDRRRDRP
jgi:hypothetical protein